MLRRSFLVSVALATIVVACTDPAASVPGVSPSTGASAQASPSLSPTPTPAPTPAPTPTAAPPSPTPTEPAPSPTPSPPEAIAVRAYFFLDDPAGGNPALVPVLRRISPAPGQARATAEDALAILLGGPRADERAADPKITTVVPEGTELLGLTIADGLATVDLSDEFAAGGGSFAVRGRLAQVVYTLTQFAAVNGVALKLGGEPVTVFSPEGIIIDEPLTRADFRDDFLPAIFVDRPAWGATLQPSDRVAGLANVFEAQFRLTLLDARGRVILDGPVSATCGTGCWGRFDIPIRYEVSRSQWATLRVWDPSEADGSPESVREYPVWLLATG